MPSGSDRIDRHYWRGRHAIHVAAVVSEPPPQRQHAPAGRADSLWSQCSTASLFPMQRPAVAAIITETFALQLSVRVAI